MNTIHEGFSSVEHTPVAETFFGFRAFRVVEDDHLAGVFKTQYRWTDGFNTATCLRGPQGAPQPTMLRGKTHQLLMPDCSCGFWAYTDGEHILSVPAPAVLGIIEGWGRMVLGPHGFRAERARIVALAFPARGEKQADVVIDAFEAVTRDTVRAAVERLTTAFANLAVAMNDAASRMQGKAVTVRKPLPMPTSPSMQSPRPWDLISATQRQMIAARYPTARLFDSVEAMKRAYPVSDLRALLPQDASDSTEEGVA